LDHDKAAYEEVKKEFPSFIHYSDFQGWKGKAVNDYYVYGTPSYILLDKDKKIKGRFTSLNLLLSNL